MGTIIQILFGLGSSVAFFLNYFLIKITEDTTCKSFWPVMFAFPFLILILQLVGLLFVFPYETPKYLLYEGKESEARELISEIYKEEFVEEILDEKIKDIECMKKK